MTDLSLLIDELEVKPCPRTLCTGNLEPAWHPDMGVIYSCSQCDRDWVGVAP